jgi:hypothetical protein
MPLQRTDLLTDGGLRHVIDLRCAGETLRLRQVTEDFETFDLHTKPGEKVSGAFMGSQFMQRPATAAFAARAAKVPGS